MPRASFCGGAGEAKANIPLVCLVAAPFVLAQRVREDSSVLACYQTPTAVGSAKSRLHAIGCYPASAWPITAAQQQCDPTLRPPHERRRDTAWQVNVSLQTLCNGDLERPVILSVLDQRRPAICAARSACTPRALWCSCWVGFLLFVAARCG